MSGMAPNTKPDVDQAIASVYRAEWGIVAILMRLVGDFDVLKRRRRRLLRLLSISGTQRHSDLPAPGSSEPHDIKRSTVSGGGHG